jgi:hypothetical protein
VVPPAGELRGAVKAYSEAIDGLSCLHGPKFNEAWQLAVRARKDSVVSRAALLCHEHAHGCSMHQPRVEGHQDSDVNTGSRPCVTYWGLSEALGNSEPSQRLRCDRAGSYDLVRSIIATLHSGFHLTLLSRLRHS